MSQSGSTSLKITFSTEPVPPHGIKNLDTISIDTATPLVIDDVAAALKSGVGSGSVLSVEKAHAGSPYILFNPADTLAIFKFLRDNDKIRGIGLAVVSAVDYLDKNEAGEPQEPRVELVYVVDSFAHKTQIMLKAKLDRNAPKIASIAGIYRSANWYERECYDMVGVTFEGHPNHERILLPPDWKGHPLRRDYEFPEEYNGMKVPL
ncbi:MAG TPA: NADH-quinone oxidoreductase subunit C [Bdellovibrionota bacterium]|jgi:NADH-quinone oxidoreductase subunit C|nr:NADH-quinone oxidoreductase subunit C [Bdellovibrionota bacterium]